MMQSKIFFRIKVMATALSMVAGVTACKPPAEGEGDASSGLASVGFNVPIPEGVRSKMGNGGKAQLVSTSGWNRTFESRLDFSAKETARVIFKVDTRKKALAVGDELGNVYLYIMSGSGTKIYQGLTTPKSMRIKRGTNNLSVSLDCVDKTVCNSYDNLKVNGISGSADSVSSSPSLAVDVKIDQGGQTLDARKSVLRQCVAEVKKVSDAQGCEADFFVEKSGGSKACQNLSALTNTKIASLNADKSWGGYWGVNRYLQDCKTLGIVSGNI